MRNLINLTVVFFFIINPDNGGAKAVSGYFDYYEVMHDLPSVMAAESQIATFIGTGEKILNNMFNDMHEARSCWPEPDSLKNYNQQIRMNTFQPQMELIDFKIRTFYNEFERLNLLLFCPIEANIDLAISNIVVREHLSVLADCTIPGFIPEANAIDFTIEVRAELIRLEKERTGLE